MATLTATAAQANAQAIYNVNGTVSRCIQYSIAASFSAGDVVQMCKVPNGAVVSRVAFAINGHSGVLTVNVGDGNDVSAYAASVVLSGSAVALPAAGTYPTARGFGRSYSAEDTIDIQIGAISAPVAAGTLFLTVDYTMQNGG
ncbi:MAG: hypothetical protein [Podoviridae sp. ctQNx1]|nr:MAG: hypothetical protein [Podoviridae sp. ctQNx1]UOF78137.1 hypothetical protein [Caudoviricetes sp.]